LLFCVGIPLLTKAQSYRASSKSTCPSVVEVEWYNSSAFPSTVTQSQNLGPVDNVVFSAPTVPATGWEVCSVTVFIGGGSIEYGPPPNSANCPEFGPTSVGSLGACVDGFSANATGIYFWVNF
jgi:hypothetical protein